MGNSLFLSLMNVGVCVNHGSIPFHDSSTLVA